VNTLLTLREIFSWLDAFVSFSTQEPWDNSGVLLDTGRKVRRVMLSLDASIPVAQAARTFQADLLITHHPVIFTPRKTISAQDPVYLLLSGGISCIAAHTPLDFCTGGVNDVLAQTLALQNIRSVPRADGPALLRCGELPQPMDTVAFARHVGVSLQTVVRYNRCAHKIHTVAVCGGAAGEEFISAATACGADAFVTGEIRHHIYEDAAALGLGLFTAGHFETEIGAMRVLCARLSAAFPDLVCVCATEEPPTAWIGSET
jgi:dinuclear metal center YbgI/SA1388 family protein